MIKYLTLFNTALSLVLWVPTWKKLLKLRRAEEYSLATLGMVALLQWSGLLLAALNHTGAFIWYYALNSVGCSATLGMVWWFQRSHEERNLEGHDCLERGCKVG